MQNHTSHHKTHQSTFHLSHSFQFAFTSFTVSNIQDYFISLSLFFFSALLYSLVQKSLQSQEASRFSSANKARTWLFLFLLKSFQKSIESLLMLAVMTYNFGIFLSICIGISVGYCAFHVTQPADLNKYEKIKYLETDQ